MIRRAASTDLNFWKPKMRCPICKKPTNPGPADRYRPFCSERCQLVDLGLWAGEDYRVPGSKVEDREHPDDRRDNRGTNHKPAIEGGQDEEK